MKKIIRVSTVPLSLNVLLKGQLSFLNDHFQVLAVSGPGKDLDEVEQREKVRTVAIKMEREIHLLNDLMSFWKLYLCFLKEKPDIVHSITPKAGLLSMVAAYFAGVPIRIHTFTGLIFPSKKGILKQLLIIMDRILCFFATEIFPEGEGVKQDLIRNSITGKPLKVLANGNVNGIDTSYFSPNSVSQNKKNALRKELLINPRDFIFIFVGRLVGDKGINELVAAFLKLQIHIKSNEIKSDKLVKLLLVGPLESHIDPLKKETIAAIHNNPDILSVGFQIDVRPYFSISNALVFPSYREGFPNVVIQAGAMGLPAIVTDINGSNEIIIDEINGIIIPKKNMNQVENAMYRVFSNEELRQTLQNNARKKICNRYSQDLVWKTLLEEYICLLERVK